MNNTTDIAKQKPSFEDAYRRLEEISRKLEESSTPLELSFKLYEEAQGLIRLCQTLLDDAERRIKVLKSGPDGVSIEEMNLV